MPSRKIGSFVLHLEMPASLRNSPLEKYLRYSARLIKQAFVWLERWLRGGKVKVLLATKQEIWFDFDLALINPPPLKDALLGAIMAYVKPGHVVYDVGGFVGGYAIPMADKVGQQGRVITFEPAPETAELLRRHLRLNHVADRVRVIEAACSNAPGFMLMPVWSIKSTSFASGNGLYNVHPHPDQQQAHVVVSLVRLDDLYAAAEKKPDVLKIDVEGAEMWVLQGAERILRQVRPIVFMELHRFAWQFFGTTEKELFDFLEQVSYDIVDIAAPYRRLTAIPERGYALLLPNEIDRSRLA